MSVIPQTMQAVVYRGPNDLRLESVPVPRIGPDELLVSGGGLWCLPDRY